jgi:hypothetical protein
VRTLEKVAVVKPLHPISGADNAHFNFTRRDLLSAHFKLSSNAPMPRIVFTLDDGTRIESELESDVLTIGRHPDSRVTLPSVSVSSHHATIKRKGEDFFVQDLGTTNGTKLNGVEVEEAKLSDGDQLTFGDIPAVIYLSARSARNAAPPVKPATPPVTPAAGSPGVKPGAPAPAAPLGRATAPQPVKPPPLLEQTAPVPVMPARPSPQRAPGPQRGPGYTLPQRYSKPEGGGCASFFLLVIFLALSFIAGLCIRHYNETKGGNLPVEIYKKFRTKFGLDKPEGSAK